MEEVIEVEDCGENIGDYDIPIYNAIIIPRGATNGDMVEKIFGEGIYYTLIRMMYVSCCEELDKWWNSPYKRD